MGTSSCKALMDLMWYTHRVGTQFVVLMVVGVQEWWSSCDELGDHPPSSTHHDLRTHR